MSTVGFEPMSPADWPEVRAIYAEGIATGQATFETEPPSWEGWDAAHLGTGRVVARDGGAILGWGALAPVSRRPCYSGVAEVSVYVRASSRGRGVGRALLQHLVAASEADGIWTLQGSTFPENAASLRLQAACGFRVVGRRERIAKMDGVWRDTVLTERRAASRPMAAGDQAASPIAVRPVRPGDYAAWRPLWAGYNAFYGRAGETALPEETTRTTWKRFFDEAEPVFALVAEREGSVVGIAHYLFHRSTIFVSPTCYLQDLFTAPEARGRGVGRALIEAVFDRAREAGAARVYWHTHETNRAAMRLYDTLAEKSGFIVYRRNL